MVSGADLMAERPIFSWSSDPEHLVEVTPVEFEWHPGFSRAQAQRSIRSLHEAAAARGVEPVLEISSSSLDVNGVRLSAFNLELRLPDGRQSTVECAYQGSKVFSGGGPFTDLYDKTSREAKKDDRIRESGELLAFQFFDEEWPLVPETAFYDWIYISALDQSPKLAEALLDYEGFSDISFNPARSLNCQAHSAAVYVTLAKRGQLSLVAAPHRFRKLFGRSASSADEQPGLQQDLFP